MLFYLFISVSIHYTFKNIFKYTFSFMQLPILFSSCEIVFNFLQVHDYFSNLKNFISET